MQLDYQHTYEKALATIMDMKSYMEWLRENNPESYDKRAHWLTDMWNFMKASEDMIQLMNNELDAQYQRGVAAGKLLAEKQDFAQSIQKWFSIPRRFERTGFYLNNPDLHEDLREYTKQKAHADFPNLY